MNETVLLTLPERASVLEAVDALKSVDHVRIVHSAVLAKADDGETVVYEDDINANEGAIAGGTLGSLLGAMGVVGLGAFLLPGVGAILAIGAGAVIGGLVGGTTGSVTARLLDLGLNNERVEALATKLNSGEVALVVEYALDNDADGVAAREKLHAVLAPYRAEYFDSLRA